MVTLKPAMKQTLMAVACLDRTRAIFNGGESSMTLSIGNDNKDLPYLAQAWIENAQGGKKSPPVRLWCPLCSVWSRG